MKLYRVTVRRRSDGGIYKREVFTKASSVRSFKGYWGSRGAWKTNWEKTYTVEVETAFVSTWAPLDENLEKVEAAIAAMPALSDSDISALIERLSANLVAKTA